MSVSSTGKENQLFINSPAPGMDRQQNQHHSLIKIILDINFHEFFKGFLRFPLVGEYISQRRPRNQSKRISRYYQASDFCQAASRYY